ncbi:MAG: cell division protein FtsZ [Bacteroidales bacterium]|nr:cell division protein FtsZ [Bacteroidales bacterium]
MDIEIEPINDDTIVEYEMPTKSNIIKVIGVGGGGGNAVNYMFNEKMENVDFIIANTDQQALNTSPVPIKIQLGATLTEGLGAGNDPENGKQAAIESIDEIKAVLGNSTKMLFVTAGMGGGTGTGAAPVIAKTALEMGILTVAIVTIPFRYEGPKRVKQALAGLEALSQSVDSLLVIDNEKIREIFGKQPARQAFANADNILNTAAKGIAEIITEHGTINVDFADIKSVMKQSGVALMGTSKAKGDDRAIDAVKGALNSPLLNNNDIKGAKNILVNIVSSAEHETSLDEVTLINEFVQNAAGENADLIWGQSNDDKLGEYISVTLIATGFQKTAIPNPYEAKNVKIPSLLEQYKKESEQKNNTNTSTNLITPTQSYNQNINNNQNTSAENNISENYSDNQENTIQQTEDEIEFEIEDNSNINNNSEEQTNEPEKEEIPIISTKFQKINFAELRDIEAIINKPAYERKGIRLIEPAKDAKKFTLEEF